MAEVDAGTTGTRTDPRSAAKEAAGRHAATYVESGMRVGLGTGSTVHFTIVALGERVRSGDLEIRCVATSTQTENLANSVGLKVEQPDLVRHLDIAIDGADEVDQRLNLTKGGGGALTREKIVATMADRFIVVVDDSKLVPQLGRFGTPIEVLRFAPEVVADQVRSLGAAEVRFRPEASDNGALLADAFFGEIPDPTGLASALQAVPGLIEHGLFLSSMVDRVVVAESDGSVREISNP
ncbi:MAG: ribose-5-phosphate isomerase RpiA [Acidimicrobiales bacterium]|nr:ribose-5-phosphate isomerase RpiA [Acidimicrobiales bacterium]